MLDSATASHSLSEMLGLGSVTARAVYATLDRPGAEQSFIENQLARRHLKNGTLVLYDVTSTTSKAAAVCWPTTATAAAIGVTGRNW